MRHYDFENFGFDDDEPRSNFLRRKRPAVFIYETILHDGLRHDIRVGCGWYDKPLPTFRIPFVVSGMDYVMVSNPDIPNPSKRMPSSVPPTSRTRSHGEMAFY